MKEIIFYKEQFPVICAFPGTGKSWLVKNFPNYIDLERYIFDGDLGAYTRAVDYYQKAYGYIVLTNCDKITIDLLKKNNISFVVVLPTLEQKEDYVKRYIDRKSIDSLVKELSDNYERVINEVLKTDCRKVILNRGEHLGDVINEIIDNNSGL